MSEELLVSEHTDLLSATDRQDEGQAEGMEMTEVVAEDASELESESDQKALIDNKAANGEAQHEISEEETSDREDYDKKRKTSGIAGSSFNFINSIVGAGMIGIPLAIQQSGFITGVFLLILVAIITNYTILLLIKNAYLSNKFSYQEMIQAAFGKWGLVVLTLLQFFFPFFGMCGYIVIAGDTLSRISWYIFEVADYPVIPVLVDERMIKFVIVVLIMMPVSCLRNISRLENFSALAIVFIAVILSVVLYEIYNMFCFVRCFVPDCCENTFQLWGINYKLTQGIGIMAFAYVCHHNTYLIYDSLKDKSFSRFAVVSHVSVFTSMGCVLILGISGFLTFLNRTRGDLLNNYCSNDIPANIARVCYALVVTLTYPIECFVVREVLEISLSRFPKKYVEKLPKVLHKPLKHFLYTPKRRSLFRHIFLTLLIVAATLAVGLSTNDLGIVLSFSGTLTATPLAFILPASSYIRLSKRKRFSKEKVVAWCVVAFGVVVMVVGSVESVIQLVESFFSEEVTYTPLYCPALVPPNLLANDSSLRTRCVNTTIDSSLVVPFCDCSAHTYVNRTCLHVLDAI